MNDNGSDTSTFGVDRGMLTLGGATAIGGDGTHGVGSAVALIARRAQETAFKAAQVGLVGRGTVQLDSAAARRTTGTLAIGSRTGPGEVQVTGGAFLDVTDSVTVRGSGTSMLTAHGRLVRVEGNVSLPARGWDLSAGAQPAARVLGAAPRSRTLPGIVRQSSVTP